MPPPTASQKPAGKTATNGNAAAAPAQAAKGAADHDEHSGKPDQAKYNAEQDAVNKEIAAVKAKLVSLIVRVEVCGGMMEARATVLAPAVSFLPSQAG